LLSNQGLWAVCLLLFACVTDALDGHLARRLGASSSFGAFFDVSADFLLALTAFSAFVARGIYPLWTPLLIASMFLQFILTSRFGWPLYDPVGKYYGAFLFASVGATLVLPDFAVCHALLIGIVTLALASVTTRCVLLIGLWGKRVPGGQGLDR